MTKADLIFAASGATDIPPDAVRPVLNAALDIIMEAVGAGDTVTISGFGTFSKKHRKERFGRNPGTGEAIVIHACDVPVFRPGKQLKEAVNEK